MLIWSRTKRWRPGVFAAAALTAATFGVLAAALPAQAAPDGSMLLGNTTPAPAGVSSGKPNPALKSKARGNPAMLSLRVTDPEAAAKARVDTGGVPIQQGDPYYCLAYVDTAVAQVGSDEYLEETGHVDYYAQLGCNFYLDAIEGIAGVIDRSEPYYGENYDGAVLGTGTYWYSEFDYFAESYGSIDLRARQYNGGREVEAAFELYLLGPIGFVWDECNPIPDLRYLACDGLGTDFLHVVVGTDRFSTGLTRACRNMNATLDPEQARINLPAGNPAATQILNKAEFAPLKQQVIDFKRNICLKNSGSEVVSLADQAGQQLWDGAVAIAKANGGVLNDDRGLYWARLQMTATIHQYVRFSIDIPSTEKRLDRPARGMTSHTFDRGTAKKAFISGFDPFGLDGAIFRGNPSGASVLRLDNEIVNGAEVEAVIFPVRYADFDEGLVDVVFRPHVQAGSQQATIVTTVSQGGDPTLFELEFYNGRRRASFAAGVAALPDNRKELGGGGTYDNPIVPPGANGAEFIPNTLPVDAMVAGRPAIVDTTCDEKAPPGSTSRTCVEGPRLGSTAVQGSGGGYLSNEIAYRVTMLRDATGSTVPAGHVHTPILSAPSGTGSPGFGTVSDQYRDILSAGIGAPPRPAAQVTTNTSLYRVGETPVYTVIAAPSSVIKWSSTKDGAPTGELNRVYTSPALGPTDATGTWTGPGDRAWTDADVGTWTKYVRVNGRLAQVSFVVVP